MYEVIWSEQAERDLESLHIRHQRRIRDLVNEVLPHQSTSPETLNRKMLREPLDDLPEAEWELKSEDYRIFYFVDEDEQETYILRVIFKGNWTMSDALVRSRKRRT
jgi:mRNA-degrading endonuclease RelE of RelBE toxin-antitoxin system